jgi:RNA polymerase sigma factor (sigma-70 family)
MKEKNPPRDQFRLVGFLYSYFFYLLKKNVDTFLIDQLGRKTFPLLSDDFFDDDPNSKVGFRADPIEYTFEQIMHTDSIDEMWVLGEKVMAPFDKLTVQDRQLIKWRYIDGKKSSEISQKINEHPNTVREHLSRIKEKIEEIIVTDNLEDLIRELKLSKE